MGIVVCRLIYVYQGQRKPGTFHSNVSGYSVFVCVCVCVTHHKDDYSDSKKKKKQRRNGILWSNTLRKYEWSMNGMKCVIRMKWMTNDLWRSVSICFPVFFFFRSIFIHIHYFGNSFLFVLFVVCHISILQLNYVIVIALAPRWFCSLEMIDRGNYSSQFFSFFLLLKFQMTTIWTDI